ncbi:MAG: GntR family transcriptional regulator [Victivallales bacterium]
MNDLINKNNVKPIYLQVKDSISAAIKQGELVAGGKILSENSLSKKYGIHRHTARNSLRLLSEEGLITSIPGRGWFVTEATARKPMETDAMPHVTGGAVAVYGMIPQDTVQSYFATSFLNSLLASGAIRHYNVRFLSDEDMHNIETQGHCSIKFDVIIWINPSPGEIPRIEKLSASGTKIVVANRHLYGSTLPFVSINQYSGTRELTSRMINAGHRRIGCITSDLPYRYLSERWCGFCDALYAAGIEPDENLALHVTDSSDIRTGLKNLFESNRDMTALFLAGEIFHRQAFEYIGNTGRKIPDDISVAAFDTVKMSDFKGKIASVEQPVAQMSEQLFSIIAKLLDGGKVESGVIIEPVVRTGESIRKIN